MFENAEKDFVLKGILEKYVGDGEKVVVPDGITEIADGAFENASVREVRFADSVVKVGANAFKGCEKLEKISFGKSVRSFGADAFSGCSALKTVDYSGETRDWCKIDFAGFTANPLFYGDLYFNGAKLDVLTVNADEIKDYAFCGLNASTVVFNSPLKRVGTGAFADCKATGVLDVDVEEIGELAFRGTAFDEIRLGKSLKKVESWAFFKCSASKVYYAGDVADWLKVFVRDVWANPLYGADFYAQGKLITDLKIPDGIKEIPDAAFAGVNILSLELNEGLTKIGEAAFYGCEKLEKVVGLNNGISVHPDAFALCSNLKK